MAERQDYSSADADGPDDSGDGYVAYNELSSEVAGTSANFLGAEIWEGAELEYIDLNDIPNINCPEASIRCIASLDVRTKNGDWNESEQSYSIEIS